MIACENSGHLISVDFPEVRKIVEAGATTKSIKDYELTRYACYLVVQNGDPKMTTVLFLLRSVKIEVTIGDLDLLTIGYVDRKS